MRKYFSYTYNRYSEEMSYYLFCPIRNLNRPLPLIVWLHGSGECGVNRKTFMREGLPAVLNNWTLRPFGAYILCPQLNVEDDIWAKDESVNKIMDIINEVISENNINTNKIILCGHSLGAMGCTYIAERIHNFFSYLSSKDSSFVLFFEPKNFLSSNLFRSNSSFNLFA